MAEMRSRGRPSMLEDPSFVDYVAELFASGIGREKMLEKLQEEGFDVRDKATITRWRKNPAVKAKIVKINEDRAIQISRRIDAIIAGRLAQAEKLTIKDLIMIRKEFGGATLGQQQINNSDEVAVDAMKAMENNPNFMQEVEALFSGENSESSST